MKKNKLTMKETIVIASTLFGMFFGAGNLIIPVKLGQDAGANAWPAILGFCITAVTIPILAVAAMGNTGSDNLMQLSSKVGKKYAKIFTAALYLTIGPFCAIPRCAATSFTISTSAFAGGSKMWIWQLIFTFIFFALVLFFSLRPSGITTWIGKVINPIFLALLGVLLLVALIKPGASIASVTPNDAYQSDALFKGFIDGYATMDAIAGLAFGIVIIAAVRDLGVERDSDVAKATIKAGVFAGILMAVLYVLIIVMGVKSRGPLEIAENGGIALAQISKHYLGGFGYILLGATMTFACLKTAIGLVTSCGEMFVRLIPGKLNYRGWSLVFTLFSLIVSNVGLTAILKWAVPVLMLIYPLTITLIVLALCEKLFGKSREVYMWVTVGAFIPAVFDFLKALNIQAVAELGSKIFPFFDHGLGWVVPSIIGLVIGLVLSKTKGAQNA